ncbi:MAG: phage tail family protein [Candidatus Pristimantibacillus lignocellulolyticus]|uniref:Phage tail family protein n=1 Tax=Candidatus Pristimantibacillus lignocellulolyticus TaxID=2994561 RepID=A0A9J6ZEG2_9BACL|nr:MAG: phage tail family protein [Candidatus Pristimantibacillus lignocellulolyticus]
MVRNGGFTLDGIPARTLKILMTRESDRPIAPSTVDRFLSIPGRNGVVYFGADVGARLFSLDCKVNTRNPLELQDAVELIASVLLDGYGKPRTVKLVFDSRPDRYYLVCYSGSLSPKRMFGLGSFTLPLITVDDPYARSLTNSGSVIWDSAITWSSDIRWGDSWSRRVTGNTTLEINNWGTMIVKPIIEITGSYASVAITINDNVIFDIKPLTNGKLIIDCERMTMKKNGMNALSGMVGKFVELEPGINKVIIDGTSLNADVSFVFESRYF